MKTHSTDVPEWLAELVTRVFGDGVPDLVSVVAVPVPGKVSPAAMSDLYSAVEARATRVTDVCLAPDVHHGTDRLWGAVVHQISAGAHAMPPAVAFGRDGGGTLVVGYIA